jgi:DNA-binding transcriptional LysR family regulator
VNLNTLDLNLFLVFRAIYVTRSVTAAGERLCMTQSAVSNALKRLRDRFNDPLFVRTPAGMQPTPMANQLIDLVEDGLQRFMQAIERARNFDPAGTDRLFRLAVNDIGQLVVLPGLVEAQRAAAPGARLETVLASNQQQARQLLQDGDIDLALGSWPPMGAGFHERVLFTESFATLVRHGHALALGAPDLETYLACEHAAYRPSGASDWALQSALTQEGVLARRKVVLTVAHFGGLASVVAASDLVLTVPCRLAEALRDSRPDLTIAPLPFHLPPFPVWLHWHERGHADGGHRWLRELLVSRFGDLPMPPFVEAVSGVH